MHPITIIMLSLSIGTVLTMVISMACPTKYYIVKFANGQYTWQRRNGVLRYTSVLKYANQLDTVAAIKRIQEKEPKKVSCTLYMESNQVKYLNIPEAVLEVYKNTDDAKLVTKHFAGILASLFGRILLLSVKDQVLAEAKRLEELITKK